MRDINDYILDLYKDGAEITDLVGIFQELLTRIQILEGEVQRLKAKETL